jgi:hypothetical protein
VKRLLALIFVLVVSAGCIPTDNFMRWRVDTGNGHTVTGQWEVEHYGLQGRTEAVCFLPDGTQLRTDYNTAFWLPYDCTSVLDPRVAP